MSRHNSTNFPPQTTPCWGCRTWSQTKNEVVGTHEEPIYENKWADGSATTIRVCALCGQMELSTASGDHTHQYVEKTVSGSGTGGHYEDVQVQIGTKTVNDYEDVTVYGCGVCSFTTYDGMEVIKHTDPHYEESKKVNGGHMGANWWSETKKVVVGTHEEPDYWTGRKWVEDSPTTIRVCEICGQQEP